MASVQTSKYDNRYLKLTVVEESTSIENNTSTLRWTLESISGNTQLYSIFNWGVWVNGQEIYNQQTTPWYGTGTKDNPVAVFPASKGSKTGTITVNHNADGTASDVNFTLKGSVYYNRDNSYSSSISLTKIPRQANLTDAPDFNDEQNPTIEYTNSAGTSVNTLQACISLTGARDDISYRDISKTGSSYTFNLTNEERNILQNSCTNSNSREVIFFVRTIIAGNTYYSTKTKKLTIINGNPVFLSSQLSYQDSDNNIVSITGNNQHIVRNNSNLKVSYTSAQALKGASIKKYEITFNGTTQTKTSSDTIDYGKVNISSNVYVYIKVIDSRNNSTTISKEITILDWLLPTAVINYKRKNNYEDETTIKAKTTISSVNNKNSITSLKFRYKKTTSSTYSSFIDLSDDTGFTLQIDKNYVWDVQLILSDKFGTTTYNFKVPKGVFILFIDTKNQSVGVNCFPTESNSMFINGYNMNLIHPINSIIMTSDNTNPSSSIFGTWQLLTSQSINGNTIYYWKRTE